MIRDSGASVVLCLEDFIGKVHRSMPAGGRPTDVVALHASSDIWKTGDRRRPVVNIHPQDGAYVIYTSVFSCQYFLLNR